MSKSLIAQRNLLTIACFAAMERGGINDTIRSVTIPPPPLPVKPKRKYVRKPKAKPAAAVPKGWDAV